MTLSAGTRLGPYEILSPLGAGGMGEVYRARDTRLGREVAVKVLLAPKGQDSGRFKRFRTEAHSTAALSHSSIVAIYDIGEESGQPYIVSELISGGTLDLLILKGPLPARKLLELAVPIAEGLAAAHAQGIVHRDLKPENILLTPDGAPKIADFGLAKYFRPAQGEEGSLLTTLTNDGTKEGTIVGTVSYMSPEQAQGEPLDYRSDQFSFGSVLYEMATGKRAFRKMSVVQTLAAIMQDEPEPIGSLAPKLPAPLRWIIERCLSKEPGRRYASTEDLARELATVRDHLSETSLSMDPLAVSPASSRRRLAYAAAAAALVAASLYSGKVLWRTLPPAPPRFQRLTFRPGMVDRARFSTDGQTVVYAARWGAEPKRVFSTRIGSLESSALPLPDSSSLLALSSTGELAVLLRTPMLLGSPEPLGTLATMPLAGGAPREVANDVRDADWAPDGKTLLVLRGTQLELPIGKVFYKAGPVASMRFSPLGDRIAIVEERESGRLISVIDLKGEKTELVRAEIKGSPVWSPKGDEIWWASGGLGFFNEILAVTLKGASRVVTRLQGASVLDVSRDGRVLMKMGTSRNQALYVPAGETRERDLSWFSSTDAAALAADGKTVLLREYGEEGGPNGTTYLRSVDGSPAVKVTEGIADALSPDSRWAASIRDGKALLMPTGAGETRTLAQEGFQYRGVRWFPDGDRLLVAGSEAGQKSKLYVQDLAGGKPKPLSTEGITGDCVISPDGSLVAADQNDGFWIYPVSGGERRKLPGVLSNEYIASWSEDGRAVYATVNAKLPFEVYRVDVTTGWRELWKTIAPADMTGIYSSDLLMLPNGTYILNVKRYVSDLYLVDGLR